MTDLEREFLHPRVSPAMIRNGIVRSAIVSRLRSVLPEFHGTVLDIGCGRMPYKSLVTAAPARTARYLGMDLKANPVYRDKPDVEWDGSVMPLDDASVDCAIATEILEHCPDPEVVLKEAWRVLRPGGFLFFTVPFLWPLHDVPWDNYRYTPFSLERHLKASGFTKTKISPLGGWDASLGQMLGLWIEGRPMRRSFKRLGRLLTWPIISILAKVDRIPSEFHEGQMITGLWGMAWK